MAAAILDLDINEGETFLMSIDLWENVDQTIPIDITGSTFSGAMQIGQKYIPLTITIKAPAVNVIEATVDYTTMVDLANTGKYDIEQLTPQGEKFRLIQGRIRVNQEVTV